MKKHEKLTQKGFTLIGKFNTNVISGTYRKIMKMNPKLNHDFVFKNFEAVAGTNYMSDIYAKDKESEKVFWDAKNTDGRSLR